ncbi:TRAP transporter substrate-binding protein [Desulfurispira natronophila]|uniref:TRAP-type C4-dicarboxylate transport system substrate-binding protein n=1 Tax=Desulfurispira natronophila TaxID=682562 RepID=A0A7W8DHT6_9BACT|nr:TRAP transporter substrate-binding protein [Desulfurispira natronophila]MBB5022815.1 TRAP-type C4-dicarboxylate transport system substrate-binding protein [Desulfurispira natronophila]
MPRTLALLLVTFVALLLVTPAMAQDDPTAAWQPSFDPSTAEHTYLLSNISHPAIEGVGVGYRIRDAVWERSDGRLYVDFRPLAQLGGERDVISKLRMGAVHGMLSSSVAAANVADTLGIVNLPYVVDTFDKLERFIGNEELFEEFRQSPRRSGIVAVDITSYGTYGWATNRPVRSLEDARGVNFRIAEAPVNVDIYRNWGLRFTVMPWPDVPQALQTGVINGLDHTPTVCNITGKFDVANYFTEVNYAQGLFVHLINERWLNRLPADLREILLDVIAEESAKSRELAQIQHEEQIADAKTKGVEFIPLSDSDRERLIEMAEPVYERWGDRIGADYLQKVRDYLEE